MFFVDDMILVNETRYFATRNKRRKFNAEVQAQVDVETNHLKVDIL